MKLNKIYLKRFVLPALLIYTLFFMLPVVVGIGYSFTNWNKMSNVAEFVGLKNYIDIFTPGSRYFKSLLLTLVFTLFTVLLKSGFGLGLALLLNKNIRSKGLLRGVYFLPYTLSPLIIGILFRSILAPGGVVNGFLSLVGLSGLTRSWLTTPSTVLGAVIGVEVWRMVGWNMVMFMAGLQSIPEDYYEASSIDGAAAWRQFFHITFPLLIPSLTITTVLNTIHGIKAFDLIFALTDGGPGSLTEVINVSVFRAFSQGRYGMSTSLGVVVFLIALVFALLIKNSMMREETA